MNAGHFPLEFAVDYPERPLNRLSTFFRLIVAVPILILLAMVLGSFGDDSGGGWFGIGGVLFGATALMIVFRQKYPRWWFTFNLELQRFINRVMVFLALMDDRYPSTDEEQSVHLNYGYPDVPQELNRWLPLVKWALAIPHYIVLFFLNVAAVGAILIAWVAIMFTSRYPRGLFGFVEGVLRWNNRVIAYAGTLVTDQYPPFSLR